MNPYCGVGVGSAIGQRPVTLYPNVGLKFSDFRATIVNALLRLGERGDDAPRSEEVLAAELLDTDMSPIGLRRVKTIPGDSCAHGGLVLGLIE